MKRKILIIIISIIFLSLLGRFIFNNLKSSNNVINYFDKEYYIKKYGSDLDSNLSIFPNDINSLDSKFSSKLKTGLFDTDGYILLTINYDKEKYDKEIERLSKLNMIIKETCYSNSKSITNYVKYDDKSYEYPAYITIDGFSNKYEYALLDKNNLKIIYIYLSYPNINDINYNKYLKKDKSYYSNSNSLNLYSMYNHSFDNGKSYMEYNDC